MFPRVTHPSATSPEGPVRLACVRPAASVHSEPGSNSQVESSEELSLTSNLRTSACIQLGYRSLQFMCSSYRSNQNPQTVKLSPRSSVCRLAPASLPGRYANSQTPMRPNRPHISSSIQFSKSADTKQTTHPNFGRICRRASKFRCRRSIPRPVNPVCITASRRLR